MLRSFSKFLLLFMAFCAFLISFSCQIGDFENTVDVHITFYVNDPENNGRVTSSECTLHIQKGSVLQGTPNDWADDWSINKIDDKALYGFVGDGNIGSEGVPYRFASIGGSWYFKHMKPLDGTWDTGYKVNKSLHITPDYVTDSGDVAVKFNFAYYKKDGDNYVFTNDEVYSYTEKELKTDKYLDIINNNSALFQQDKDSDLSYGYIDVNDHKHRYYFDQDDSASSVSVSSAVNYTFYELNDNGEVVLDSDGYPKEYHTSDKITGDFDGKTFTPAYISAGYVNIPGSAKEPGGIPDVEQVFVPGNIKPDGSGNYLFPFSNFAPDSDPRPAIAYHNNSLVYFDDSTYGTDKLSIPNMYVMEVPVTTALYNTLKAEYPSDYTLASRIKTDFKHIYNLSYLDACILANMLTEYYNSTHADQLTYAYYYHTASAGSYYPSNPVFNYNNRVRVYADNYLSPSDSGADNKRYIVVNPNATGFRLPYSYEWEYWARIITDERQIPYPETYEDVKLVHQLRQADYNAKKTYSTVIKPTPENGLKYYFQSAKGDFDSTNDTTLSSPYTYVGSGAGLAYWDGTKYDKNKLRNFMQAVGRTANKAARTREADRDMMKSSPDGTYDINRKNGAGLWGMTGTLGTYVYTTYGFCLCGADFNAKADSYRHRLFLSYVSQYNGNPHGSIDISSARFCRVAK